MIKVPEEILLDYLGLLLMEHVRSPDNDEGDFMKCQIDQKMAHIKRLLEEAENEKSLHAVHKF